MVVEEAILYIEELQRQLKDRLEETLEEEERQHWEEMEEVVEKEEFHPQVGVTVLLSWYWVMDGVADIRQLR